METIIKIFLFILLIPAFFSCSIFDYQAPVITIENPTQDSTVPPVFVFKGSVSDNGAVKSVVYSLDGSDWQELEGLYNWYKLINLTEAGSHVLIVQAEDYNGNIAALPMNITMEEE